MGRSMVSTYPACSLSQYVGFLASTISLPCFHSLTTYGPVPTGLFAKAFSPTSSM